MKSKTQAANKLLTASWLSGLIAITSGLIVILGTIFTFSLNHSQAQQQLDAWQNTSSPALTLPGQSPPNSNNNSLQNTWPLIGFWAAIGLITYYIIEAVISAFREAAEFRQELDYVHARRNEMLKNSAVYLFIRIISVIIWLFFIEIFFKRIIPQSIYSAHLSAQNIKSWQALEYGLLSFSLIALSMHLHTIFLRVALHRSRVFSDN